MNKFWVGLKNKKVISVVFLFLLIFFSFFTQNNANAEKIDQKNCSNYGGTYNAVGCVVNASGVGGSQTLVTDTKQLEKFYVLKADNDKYKDFKCPSGYKKVQESGYTVCNRSGSNADKKETSIQSKNTIDSVINSLKSKDEYNQGGRNMTDQDWNEIKEKCKDKKGQDINNCVNENALSKVDKKLADSQKQAEEKKSDDKNSCAIEWVGWIVCPIVRGSNAVVVGLYGFVQENFLNIKADKLFTSSGGKGKEVYDNWVKFRDMANIFFVIMIAIIIFSQVTGMGISSYGIKKMLPKIIIYAILVNISWYIVVIAVDISNIVGSTLFDWLSGGGKWDFSSDAKTSNSPVEGILTGAAVGSVIVAGVTAALVAGSTIMLFIISATIAIIMTVAILMVREAAVIVLVVLSPIAFVFGLLPNTESIFKRWAKLLKNMLMIYPICSLMVGGAILVSNLLYAAVSEPMLKVIYGVLPMLSLFAIVAVIKTVLSFVDGVTGGNLRGAIDKVSGRVNSAAANSRPYKALKDREDNLSFKGIAIGKNARAIAHEEHDYKRRRNRLAKLQGKKNKTAADYRMMSADGAKIAGYEKNQMDGMVAAMTTSIGSDVSNVSGELAKISNVKDPVQQGLMYSALSQAVTKSGLNASGQAAAMNSIAQSALSISDKDQRKAVAAQIASKAGSDFKKVNPAAAKAVMQDFSNPASLKSVAQMESDISTYSGASAKQMADWATMSSSNVNDNKAVQAMRSAFASGDQSKISQAQNMGKIAEQALTANANGTMSLTPDQQKNFAAMQQLATAHSATTASQTTATNTATPTSAATTSSSISSTSNTSTQTRKQQTVKVAPSYNVVGVPQSSNIVSKGSASYNPGPALTTKPTPPASNASPSASSGAAQAQNNASNPQTPWRRYN